MLIHTNRNSTDRRGIVLLVVISMLALFAALGLSFVYYAQAEAEAALLSTQAQNQRVADIDPEFLMSYALSQLILGVDDVSQYGTNNNVLSALRGHDLARNMYGYSRSTLNVTPFNGLGRPSTLNDGATLLNTIPVSHLPNFTWFPSDGFVRDPGRYLDPRATASAAYAAGSDTKYIGENVPYTYADLQNMFLGQMDAEGKILIQSFWRPWASESLGFTMTMEKPLGPEDPTHAYYKVWGKTAFDRKTLKYMTLRPLPWYQARDASGNLLFPGPEDGGGDVRNNEFGPGVPKPGGGYYNNDSIWVDLGFPLMTGPDGKRFKPLFAFLIVDLDGKVNINAAGNLRGYDGANYSHLSNKGYTPTEINLAKILPYATSGNPPTEWQNVLRYYRYGNDQRPGNAGQSWTTGTQPSYTPYWGVMDSDSAQNDPANPNPTYPYMVAQNKYSVSEKVLLPGDAANPSVTHLAFPHLPPNTYQNGGNTPPASELYELPWLYDYYNPGGSSDDRRFRWANMEALLRYSGTGSPMLTSELFQFLSGNFNDVTGDPSKKRWRMLTLHSADLARPGITPWLFNPSATDYSYTAGDPYPRGSATATPPYSSPFPPFNSAAPNAGEFGRDSSFPFGDFRGWSAKSTATRFSLQTPIYDASTTPPGWRLLTPYPQPEATGHIDTADANLAKAINDRQQFAKSLFDRLRLVTMGARPSDAAPAPGPQLDALKWLAQFAVNLVDAIDEDNIMTVFPAGPLLDGTAGWNPADPTAYVVGTELPRLLLNEAYAQIENHKDDATNATATKPYQINFWVELINPLRNTQIDRFTGLPYTERLHVPDVNMNGQAWAAYKLNILEGTSTTVMGGIFTPGDPAGAPLAAQVKLEVVDFSSTGAVMMPPPAPTVDSEYLKVKALDQATSKFPGGDANNDGFYVLAPLDDYKFPTTDPMIPVPIPTLKLSEFTPVGATVPNAMTYSYDPNTMPPTVDPTTIKGHSIVLRRLANPFLKPEPNPALPGFNPYVTVDYLEGVKINDGVAKDAAAIRTPTAIPERFAVGRKQPYAAKAQMDPNGNVSAAVPGSQIVQQPPNPALMAAEQITQPKHSLFSHNATMLPPQPGDPTLTVPFDWLRHFDNALTSPIELLHVSGYRPHELTQQFITWDAMNMQSVKHQHRPNWFDPANRLYRFLEYMDTGWRNLNISKDGRYPGKININTIWNLEVFQALCDRNDAVHFTDDDIDNLTTGVFKKMIESRSPSGQPSGNDRPFMGLAAPFTSANDGIDSTILRKHPTNANQRLFEIVPAAGAIDHPTKRMELLNKIFNNITTRSNVFAVWMTVGFFEVHDEDKNGNGVLDGAAEDMNGNGVLDRALLGKEIGRDENRHVRHRMFAIVDRTALLMPEAPALLAAPVAAGSTTVPIRKVSMISPNRVDFKLQAGMVVEVDTGANMELVQIAAVNYAAPTPTITITMPFTNAHAAGVTVSVPQDQRVSGPQVLGLVDGSATPVTINSVHGNPGPQLRFDHRQVPYLVPYHSIIQ